MNALVTAPQNFGALSTRLAGQVVENDLGAGISGGYGMIGYKGKVWSIRHRGNEQTLMREDGDGPRGSVELVVVKASAHISKVWYEKGFEEDSKAAPDCFSANGITPDPTSTKKQASVCASCPRNAFGSKLKQDGTAGKGKACSDSKRLAVVPLADITNEMLGGPMLLRVPAASLNDVATYGTGVAKMGFPYFGVGTRVSFDAKEAYPKFIFAPIRALTDPEAELVLAMRSDPRVDRILAEDVYEPIEHQPEESKPGLAFEQAPAAPAAAAPTPVAAPVVAAPARRRAAAPTPAATVTPAAPAPAVTGFGTAAPAAAPVAEAAPIAAAPVATTGFGTAAPAAAAPAAAPAVVDDPAFNDKLDQELEALMGKA